MTLPQTTEQNVYQKSMEIYEQAFARAKSDFAYFAKRCIFIRDKTGKVVPLELNKVQQTMLNVLQTYAATRQPVRLIILKARQMGISTIIQAYILWKMLHVSNISALEIAHDRDTARSIININRFAVKNLPAWFKYFEGLKEEYFTKFEISFASNGSSLTISSAESAEPGRGKTINLAHLSEMAFYTDATRIIRPLFAAVPKQDNSAIFIESTGNGPAGLFYELFMRAWNAREQNRHTAYTALFFPWFFHHEYQMPLPAGHYLECPAELLPYNLTQEQLYWRQWVIENDYAGDEDAFLLEYPSTIDQAFLRKDATLFQPALINLRLHQIENEFPVVQTGYLSTDKIDFETTKNVIFTPAKKERLAVYCPPQAGRQYVIGADTGSGVVINRQGDYSSADVLDLQTGEQVAHLHLTAEPSTFAQELQLLGYWYNNALVAVEVDGHGLSVLTTMRDNNYLNLYQRRVFDKINNMWVGKLGWLSTKKTKKLIIDALRTDFHHNIIKINNKESLTEMVTFVKLSDKTDQIGAVSGAKDDRVMSLAIANQIRREVVSYNVNEDLLKFNITENNDYNKYADEAIANITANTDKHQTNHSVVRQTFAQMFKHKSIYMHQQLF